MGRAPLTLVGRPSPLLARVNPLTVTVLEEDTVAFCSFVSPVMVAVITVCKRD